MLRVVASCVRPMVGMVRTAVTRYPIIPKALLGGSAFAVGDAIVQRFENKAVQKVEFAPWLDTERSGRLLKIGAVLTVLSIKWYGWLDKRFPGAAARTVVGKVFGEVVLLVPVMIVAFVGGNKLLEGCSVRESFDCVKKAFSPFVTFGIMFWGAGQAINFALVPPTYRLVYMLALAAFFDDFLLTYFHHVYMDYGEPEAGKDESANAKELSLIPEAAEVRDFVDEESCLKTVEDKEGAEEAILRGGSRILE